MNSTIQICKNMLKKRFYLVLFISIILIYSLISFIYFNLNNRIELKSANEEIVSCSFYTIIFLPQILTKNTRFDSMILIIELII